MLSDDDARLLQEYDAAVAELMNGDDAGLQLLFVKGAEHAALLRQREHSRDFAKCVHCNDSGHVSSACPERGSPPKRRPLEH